MVANVFKKIVGVVVVAVVLSVGIIGCGENDNNPVGGGGGDNNSDNPRRGGGERSELICAPDEAWIQYGNDCNATSNSCVGLSFRSDGILLDVQGNYSYNDGVTTWSTRGDTLTLTGVDCIYNVLGDTLTLCCKDYCFPLIKYRGITFIRGEIDAGEQFNPNVIYGEFTDTRDGKKYKTVTMPDGKTWMAENLNYATSSGSWCYFDNSSYCDIYGRLYDWVTAMDIDASFNSSLWDSSDENHQGVCPAGWRLPSDADWRGLVNAVGSNAATKLRSQRGWFYGVNNTDNYGFSAVAGGIRYNDYPGSVGTVWEPMGQFGFWWSTMEYDASGAYYWEMNYASKEVHRFHFHENPNWGVQIRQYKVNGLSVRCILRD